MKYIIYVFLLFIALILGNGIRHLFRKPAETNYKTVVLPKFLLIVGLIGTGIFFIVTLLQLRNNTTIGQIVFMMFSLLCSSLIIAYCNCRIEYDDSAFTAKSFWGIKHTYSYGEITGIRGKDRDVKLFLGKRVVRIDEIAVGKDQFLSFAKKQYRKWNQGKSIPMLPPKMDIFKGNIDQAGEIFGIYIVIQVICIAALILVYTQFVANSIKADDLKYGTFVFHECETIDEDLHLYIDGESQYYQIYDYKNWFPDVNGFMSLCHGETEFEVSYIIVDDENDSYGQIVSMAEKGGASFFTLDDVNRKYEEEGWKCFWLFLGLNILWFAFSLLSIYVGRNPNKFSRRFIRLFFKDGYVLYRHSKK